MGFRRGARPDGSGRPDAGPTRDPDISRIDAEFTAYALSSAGRLRDAAYLMCRDWHLAEDLTQTALTKLYVAWPRVSKAEDVNAYARKVLLRGLLDHRRRRWVGEVATGSVPDAVDVEAPDLRLTLVNALAGLRPHRPGGGAAALLGRLQRRAGRLDPRRRARVPSATAASGPWPSCGRSSAPT